MHAASVCMLNVVCGGMLSARFQITMGVLASYGFGSSTLIRVARRS